MCGGVWWLGKWGVDLESIVEAEVVCVVGGSGSGSHASPTGGTQP